MKKFLAKLLTVALVASMSTMAVTAFTADYPASSKSEGMAAPTDGTIMIGELAGFEEGWGGSLTAGRDAAFDGYLDTFYDPMGVGDGWCGVKMPEAYVLTEIRICPRTGQLGRFLGGSIWGFNGDEFDPNTATLIWESDTAADEAVFHVIKANEFIADSNKGFTSYAYFNEVDHGDVAEVELYGNPVNAPAAADPAPAAAEPAPEAPAAEAAPAEAAPAPAAPEPAKAAAPAPKTGDMSIILSLAALVSTAFVTLKLTKSKNKA